MDLTEIDKEYLTKLLTSQTLCPVDYRCFITDKNQPIQCDSCRLLDSCKKFDLQLMVRKGAEKLLEESNSTEKKEETN